MTTVYSNPVHDYQATALTIPPTVLEDVDSAAALLLQLSNDADLPVIKGRFQIMDPNRPILSYCGRGRLYKAMGGSNGNVYALKIVEQDLDGSEDFHNISKEFEVHSLFDQDGGHPNILKFVFGNENLYSFPNELSESWKTTRGKPSLITPSLTIR